jgi:release factor glutamine methyltransferase
MILSSLTIKKTLKSGILRLKQTKIPSAIPDAEVLLAFTLKKPREYLYAHPEAKITAGQLRLFRKLIARRAEHEPVAYLTGHKEFFGLDFIVNRNVLIPRPETELMVEEILKIIENQGYPSQPPLIKGRRLQNHSPDSRRVLPLKKGEKSLPPFTTGVGVILIDVGTGSGCIPIAVVKNSDISAIAIDTSSAALKTARQNARRHGVPDSLRERGRPPLTRGLRFLLGDLLEPILKNSKFEIRNSKFIILTANLPYLPTAEWRGAMPDVKKYEPRLALDGGHDGLNYYRKLLPQISTLAKNNPGTKIACLFEFCPEQKTAFKKLALKYFPNAKIEIKKDLARRDRLIIFSIIQEA